VVPSEEPQEFVARIVALMEQPSAFHPSDDSPFVLDFLRGTVFRHDFAASENVFWMGVVFQHV
jgi:hypothetical protein